MYLSRIDIAILGKIMSDRKLAVIVLAAGQGTRMKSDLPKVLHPLAGRPMVQHLMATVNRLQPDRVVVVVGPQMDSVAKAVTPAQTVVQADRLGTAHAVKQARQALAGHDGDVLVLYGDTPCLGLDTLTQLIARRRQADNPGVVVLGFEPQDPHRYGRLVIDGQGVQAIVEWKDATEQQRRIGQCNSGVMAFDGASLWGWLDRVRDDNAAHEFYLTDVVGLARQDGRSCAVVFGHEDELQGINSRAELAVVEAKVQQVLRQAAMDNGATLIDPASVFFAWDTVLGRDVVVWPQVIFGPKVRIGNNVVIKGFCHLEGCDVVGPADIGPFARLRPGAKIAENVHLGNFVEVKNADVQAGAKINHLTYVGDARVGPGTNVGAGVITANYDGFTKAFTDIGAGASIGSNSVLVAPVKVGDGAIIGAGSVITRNVDSDALAVARGTQTAHDGWAKEFRAAKTNP